MRVFHRISPGIRYCCGSSKLCIRQLTCRQIPHSDPKAPRSLRPHSDGQRKIPKQTPRSLSVSCRTRLPWQTEKDRRMPRCRLLCIQNCVPAAASRAPTRATGTSHARCRHLICTWLGFPQCQSLNVSKAANTNQAPWRSFLVISREPVQRLRYAAPMLGAGGIRRPVSHKRCELSAAKRHARSNRARPQKPTSLV